MLKGVNKLKFSSRLKNESRRYTHMSTVDVCLLLFLSRAESSVFVCFSTDSPGQATDGVAKARVMDRLGFLRFSGICCLVNRRSGQWLQIASKGNQFLLRPLLLSLGPIPVERNPSISISEFQFNYSRVCLSMLGERLLKRIETN